MYSMNSFTTSAIPLNCDKNLRVNPWTFSAPPVAFALTEADSGRDLPKRGSLGWDNFPKSNLGSGWVIWWSWGLGYSNSKITIGRMVFYFLYLSFRGDGCSFGAPCKVLRFGTSRPESASKRSFRLTKAALGTILMPILMRFVQGVGSERSTPWVLSQLHHAFCPRSGESAMYSMNSFTTSAIPLNCDKNLRVSPWTFSAPQWHLRSLVVLFILCTTKKTQINVIFLLQKSIQPQKIRIFVWKKLSFFNLKDLPASQKTEILHEKMTKNW